MSRLIYSFVAPIVGVGSSLFDVCFIMQSSFAIIWLIKRCFVLFCFLLFCFYFGCVLLLCVSVFLFLAVAWAGL